jgi:hypothetical protein
MNNIEMIEYCDEHDIDLIEEVCDEIYFRHMNRLYEQRVSDLNLDRDLLGEWNSLWIPAHDVPGPCINIL